MKSTWIVVANNNCARFFTAESQTSGLTEIVALTHPESRLHDRQMTTDLPGKIKGEGGVGHAFEQPTDPKKHEAEHFAHQVATYLTAAHNEHKFEQLLLVADPSFLGLLRGELSEHLKRLVTFELDSNIASLTPDEIRSRLPEHLPKL